MLNVALRAFSLLVNAKNARREGERGKRVAIANGVLPAGARSLKWNLGYPLPKRIEIRYRFAVELFDLQASPAGIEFC